MIARFLFLFALPFIFVDSASVKSAIYNFFNPGAHRGNLAEKYDDGYTFPQFTAYEPSFNQTQSLEILEYPTEESVTEKQAKIFKNRSHKNSKTG